MSKLKKDKPNIAKIQAFLNHPAVKNAWICQKLFGKKDSPTTCVFSNKKTGKTEWTALEVEKLWEIRAEFLEALM